MYVRTYVYIHTGREAHFITHHTKPKSAIEKSSFQAEKSHVKIKHKNHVN